MQGHGSDRHEIQVKLSVQTPRRIQRSQLCLQRDVETSLVNAEDKVMESDCSRKSAVTK
jgi:hypothetical protein